MIWTERDEREWRLRWDAYEKSLREDRPIVRLRRWWKS